MKRVYLFVMALVAILLIFNPINSLLAILIHKQLPHSILIMVVALAIGAWYRWSKEGLSAFTRAPLAIKIAVGLMLWCLLNIGYGYETVGEGIRGLNVDFGGILVFLVIWLMRPSKLATKRLTQVILLALGIIALFAIPDVISSYSFESWAQYLPIHYVVNVIPQIRSVTSGPNPLGTLFTVASFVIVLVFESSWQAYLAMALTGVLAGLTYARSAWIGTAVSAGGWWAYNWFNARKIVIWPIVLGVAILAGAAFGAVRFHEGIAGVLIHGQSTEEHQQAASAAASSTAKESLHDKVLGYGLGLAGPAVLNDPHALNTVKQHKYLLPITESWYIQVMQEVGIIGLLIYLWLYVELVRQLIRNNVLVAFLALGLAVNALTLEIWAADANLNILFWALAGLALYGKLRKVEA